MTGLNSLSSAIATPPLTLGEAVARLFRERTTAGRDIGPGEHVDFTNRTLGEELALAR